jgi:hypothetical protein
MQQPLSSLSRAKSKHMLYEIPIAGVQVAAFVILAIGSLTATTAICALIERFQLVEWVWNPPLFFLGLWACLGLGTALFYYGS